VCSQPPEIAAARTCFPNAASWAWNPRSMIYLLSRKHYSSTPPGHSKVAHANPGVVYLAIHRPSRLTISTAGKQKNELSPFSSLAMETKAWLPRRSP
jgi:hypothetical protein